MKFNFFYLYHQTNNGDCHDHGIQESQQLGDVELCVLFIVEAHPNVEDYQQEVDNEGFGKGNDGGEGSVQTGCDQ